MLSGRTFNYISNGKLALCIFAMLLIDGSDEQEIYHSGENLTAALQRINASPASTTPPVSKISSGSTVATYLLPSEPDIKCPENMMLEQEKNSTETFCECEASYLYYEKLDSCYKQYTRGPCTEGKLFILKSNATMARCVTNPCPDLNTVMYKGACHKLFNPGDPCESEEILIVPDELNEPICVSIFIGIYHIITGQRRGCVPGTRKAGRGKCRRMFS